MYLKELSEIPGVSGDEDEVRNFIRERIEGKLDEVRTDRMGNLIGIKKGRKPKGRLLLVAHMDEVGLMVTKINDDGTLSFAPVGGVDPRVLPGKRVRVGEDKLGIIGYRAIHLQKSEEIKKPPSYENLRIYMGFSSKKEAEKEVEIGTYVSFLTKYTEENRKATGKAFDDRGGCSILMDIIDLNERYDFDVYFAFVVQEEVGLRGSAILMEQLHPDVALVLETTTAGDNPEIPEHHWATHLGDGPVITFAHRGYVTDKRVLQVLIETAVKHGIPFQMKRRTAGGTDAGRLARRGRGVPAGVISIPARYIHSPLSIMDLGDYRNTFELVKSVVEDGKIVEEVSG
ncbi:MAG: M42 family peptidase [Thermotoga sp.]|nr:MAG: M42 family peptidase [Thermotoga sp.]